METEKHRAQTAEKRDQDEQQAAVKPQVLPADVTAGIGEHPSGVYEGEGVGRKEDSGRYSHAGGHHDYDTTKHIEDAPHK